MDESRTLIETHLRTGQPSGELAKAHAVQRSWLCERLDPTCVRPGDLPGGRISTCTALPVRGTIPRRWWPQRVNSTSLALPATEWLSRSHAELRRAGSSGRHERRASRSPSATLLDPRCPVAR